MMVLTGPAAVPDHVAAPWLDDGGPQRQWQVRGVASAAQSVGET